MSDEHSNVLSEITVTCHVDIWTKSSPGDREALEWVPPHADKTELVQSPVGLAWLSEGRGLGGGGSTSIVIPILTSVLFQIVCKRHPYQYMELDDHS